VFVTDRYRLRVRYSARGDATLAVQVDGYTTPHRLTLLADGRPHAIEQTVYPPTGSLGTYQLVAGAMHGELHLRGAELTDTGPNALLYALSTRHLGGTLSAAQRRTAWWFHATVTGCKPCALRLAVSDPRMWWMRGATVLGTYESSGQSTGMLWSQGVTGAATWVLDGGTGRREVDVIFVPALLAAGGVLASVAVLVFGLILLRRPEHVAARGIAPPQQSFARSAEMLRALGLLAAVAVAVFSDRAFADVLGAVLWGGIVALAAAMWFSPAPVRADTSRDLAA
jgi:hypothetical protein